MTELTRNSSTAKEFSFFPKSRIARKLTSRLGKIDILEIDLYRPRCKQKNQLKHIKFTQAQSLYLARFKLMKSYSFDRNSFIEEQRREVQKRHLNLGKKGFHDFITHIIRHLKSIEGSGQPLAQIDIAKSLEHFRQHYSGISMKPYEHMRNIAYWLQQLTVNNATVDIHTALAEAVLKGLKNAGYKYSKLETRYRLQTIITPVFTDEALAKDMHAFLKQRDTYKQSASIARTIIRIGFTPNALVQYP